MATALEKTIQFLGNSSTAQAIDVLLAALELDDRRYQAATARALVAVLGALKGAFVKAGQFASVRHDLVPQAAAEPLRKLQSQVPSLPFETIRKWIETELGASLDSLFEDFEREPLGAASVAQVHRARLPTGEIVAVKVQYPWLRTSVRADLAVLRLCVRFRTD